MTTSGYTPAEVRRDNDREETMVLRRDCLAALRVLGVTKVKAKYDGYADMGQINPPKFKPKGVAVDDDLVTKVTDLMLRIAVCANPGFENDDGGFGKIHWRLDDDHIAVWHRACSYDEFEAEDEVA